MKCDKCSNLPVAMESCQAVYHQGTVYVTNNQDIFRPHDYRIYDYSVSKDIWNITPTELQKFALAAYSSQVVLVKKEGSNSYEIFPLTDKAEKSTPIDSFLSDTIRIPMSDDNQVRSTCMTAAGTSNMLVVADCKLIVFSNQTNPKKFSLPVVDVNPHHIEFYFSITFHDNHLYLAPMSRRLEYHHFQNVYYVPLNQIDYKQLVQQDQQADHSQEALCNQQGKRVRRGDEESEKGSKKARLDPLAHSDKHSDLISIKPDTQSRNGDKPVNQNVHIIPQSLEWKKLSPLMCHNHSNLATFGKQLVTVVDVSNRGVEIHAYSPITDSWVVVADTGDSIPHDMRETNILRLDDTGQLMLIGAQGRRDVYKLSITGLVICMYMYLLTCCF